MSSKVTRRQFLQVTGATAGLAVAERLMPAGSTSRVAQAAAGSGALVFARTIDIFNWDPFNQAAGNYSIFHQVYNPLILYNSKTVPQPMLAQEWQLSPDKKRLTLKLRKDVRFHSGRPFTADDVVYNVKRAQDPKLGANLRTLALPVTDARALDPSTAVLEFERPYALIFDLLDNMLIVDKDTADHITEKSIGTGPFVRDTWDPGNRVVLKRNDHYWNAGHPYLDSLEIRVMPDPSALVVSVQTGQSQIADNPPAAQAQQLTANKNLRILNAGLGDRSLALLLNTKQAPFDNVKIRQAMNWSIDRDRIARVVLLGFGKAATIPWPEFSQGFDAGLARSMGYDLGKAKNLLKEAGYPNGVEGTITVSRAIEPERAQAAEIIAADLATIGCRMKISDVAAADYRKSYINGEYQMAVHSFSGLTMDPIGGMILNFGYKPAGSTHYDSDEYRRLIEEASSEFDKAKRKDILHRFGQLLLTESFSCTIAQRGVLYIVRQPVAGFTATVDGLPRFENTKLSG